jgi:hypothetical protein
MESIKKKKMKYYVLRELYARRRAPGSYLVGRSGGSRADVEEEVEN